MSPRRFMATAILLVVPVVAACSSSKTTSSAPTTAGSPTTAAAAGAPEASPSGDIPDNQVFVESTFPAGGFALKVPEGWARIDVHGTTTFSDKLNRIAVQTVASPTAPTVASAQSQEVPAIAASNPAYQAGKATMVSRAAGPAVLVTYRADAPADPVTGKVVRDDVERYELWRNGTEVVLTLCSPVGADNVDPWKTVTDSLRWT